MTQRDETMKKYVASIVEKIGDFFRKYPVCKGEECKYSDVLECKAGTRFERKLKRTFEDKGLITVYESLDDMQKKRLKGMLCRTCNNPINRGLFVTGAYSIKDAGVLDDDNVLYCVIRGSVSRGDATRDDDVDVYIIGNNPKQHEKSVTDASLSHARKLKEKIQLSRKTERIVTCIAIDSKDTDIFVSSPAYIDMELFEDSMPTSTKRQKVRSYLMAVDFRMKQSGILEDLERDPMEFKREIVKMSERYRRYKNEKYLSKEKSPKLLPSVSARLHGIKFKDNIGIPQHNIMKLRDAYLFDFLYKEYGFYI